MHFIRGLGLDVTAVVIIAFAPAAQGLLLLAFGSWAPPAPVGLTPGYEAGKFGFA